ncbi:ATP-binding cassette domain-containing protein [Pseudochelatococcus contaminans]|uniref:Iron complex transport system ATP-binding protein n=1 Tax=Pseudochelatococcus contaminans TaxID=1538103 RepID=A0A7W6EHX7_9HYPH|nr:iron complex transport system ATP-binding protein [Pseudochelatococcus contaminans]
MSLLDVRDLHVRLGARPVLRGISLNVDAGEFVGLIGPNGAGKTTLMRATLGLVPSRGIVALAGNTGLSARERAKVVAYVPQAREVNWPLTVERVVSLGRMPHLPAFSSPGAQDRDAVARAMRRMGVAAFAGRAVTELSGGEQARVLIARALAQDAPLLLADEPTAGLDPEHQITLMRTFAGIAREGGSVVACLHDLGLAASWCTRLVLMEAGAVVADGPPRDVLTLDRLRSVYHVEAYVREHDHGLVVQPLDLIAPRQ